MALLCLHGPGSEFSDGAGVSKGSLIPWGQDFSCVHLEAYSEMINMQKIYWRMASGPMLVGEEREQGWAEGEVELQGSLSDSLS